jgi:chemotaxis protein MotB
MNLRQHDDRRRMKRGAGLWRVAGVAVLLSGTLACVTRGTYDTLAQERDALAAQKATLEAQLGSLEDSKQELTAELSERERRVSEMRGTYDALVEDLESELSSGQVEIEQLRNGIRLNVSDEILFPSGSARLDERGRELLEKVATQVVDTPHRVEVEGHTDDVPITGALTSRYPTNWELAAARAARVVRLLEQGGITGARMRAVSRSEFDPVTANDSAEGRRRNRRIEIRLVPATPPERQRQTAAAPTPS